ncbi:YihY/virulence factor BrkB family protein [Sphingomonas sp. RHCKR47]|uniref:YihY/virulence factor BrkB family protein n=1 Tax=Sphingomonas citricola TaxID=2862498 RepID=UPI001C669971|nr:YihY/virulence factor BrkB family protein [Sphingomonas citricola]MBW6524626.1 YihY/virulence factor BrkB family protein [Sphingomonas citricola]
MSPAMGDFIDEHQPEAITRWIGRLWRTVRSGVRDDFGIAASSIAFAAFLAIVPLVGLITAAYGFFVPATTVAQNLRTLTMIMPADAREIVSRGLHNALVNDRASVTTLLVSVGIALFSARRAGRSLLHGINLAYRIERERRGLRRLLVSITLVLGCAALVLTALVSLSVLAFLQSYVPDGLPGGRLVSVITLFGSLTLGASAGLILIYRYAPASEHPIGWRDVLPGTVAGVTMWLAATILFRSYVAHVARFDDTYGSLAAVVVLMLWLMVSAWALLLGARLNAEAMHDAGSRIKEIDE